MTTNNQNQNHATLWKENGGTIVSLLEQIITAPDRVLADIV